MTPLPHLEQTFLLIKPDGVQRRKIGEIIARFEKKGLKLVALKMLHISRQQAERQYACHREKPFYQPLVDFMTKGPCVAMVVEGMNAIAIARKLMGATDPLQAPPGTIRGDMATDTRYNLIHGSDSPESAAYEMPIFFSPEECFDYGIADSDWLCSDH